MKKKRILSIDDNATFRDIIKTMLEASGYEVLLAEDADAAFNILNKEPRPIDLFCIILDVEMPGMCGWDVLTKLKIHEDTKNIPVIMLTGEAEAEDMITGYQIGANYYITKPFKREQLIYGIQMATGDSC